MGVLCSRLLIAGAALAVLHAPALRNRFQHCRPDYQTANGWAITVTPYAWTPGFVGDFTIRGYNVTPRQLSSRSSRTPTA